MSDNIIYLIIVITLFSLLIIIANRLDRRAKKKGDLLTGKIKIVEPAERIHLYGSLLITLVGMGLVIWGYLIKNWILLGFGIFLFILSVGYRFFRKLQSVFRKEKPRPSAEALKPVLITYAEQIVEAVAPTVKLDYSPQSIQDIENVLSGIHDGYLKSGDDTGLNGIALEFAAYIVEVIKRNYGPVKWDRDGSEFGPDSYPLSWRGKYLFPYTWCQKRIFDGPDDNVWIKFKLLVMDEN